MYTKVHALEGNSTPSFPRHYPKSVLLGCVYIVDCLMVREGPAQLPPKRLYAGSTGCFE